MVVFWWIVGFFALCEGLTFLHCSVKCTLFHRTVCYLVFYVAFVLGYNSVLVPALLQESQEKNGVEGRCNHWNTSSAEIHYIFYFVFFQTFILFFFKFIYLFFIFCLNSTWTEVLCTPRLTSTGFKPMTCWSWQHISCHWNVRSIHSAVSDVSGKNSASGEEKVIQKSGNFTHMNVREPCEIGSDWSLNV